jgi:DNA-binding transcriptional LysR family regulator
MKIREMELLVRVAETGSMTLAAKQLELTPAAVSSTLQRVENALGIRLFERTTRSVRPSDEGLVVLEGCRELVARWQEVLDEAQSQRSGLTGTVHLSAPADTTYGVLAAVAVALSDAHPGLQVVFDVSDAVQHLHRDALDLAIRYGPLQDSALTARKLADTPTMLVAAPSYLRAHGAPAHPSDLSAHRCLTLQRADVPAVTWALHRDGETREVTVDSPLTGDGYLVRRWAVDGHGIALKALLDVIDDLEAGRLEPVLPDWLGETMPVHVVLPSRRFLPARVRAVAAAVTAAFAARTARCAAWSGAR